MSTYLLSITRRTASESSVHYVSQAGKRRRVSTGPPYRALLFGADNFSCTTLEYLHKAKKEGLLSELTVVVPPEQRVGRGLKELHIPPLRLLAENLGVPVVSLPRTLLKGWEPPPTFLDSSPQNLLLTASFGHLIPTRLLKLFPPLNALNVHPSLLPKYRGASPIQYAIISSDDKTGVTVQELSRGKFDHGRILNQAEVDIPPASTFHSLEPILAAKGAQLLVDTLARLDHFQCHTREQGSSGASLAPKIVKEDGRIRWDSQTAENLIQWQRGAGHQAPLWTSLRTGPSTLTRYELQLEDVDVVGEVTTKPLSTAEPGTIQIDQHARKVILHCLPSSTSEMVSVVVHRLRAEGGKWVGAWDWCNGRGQQALKAAGGKGLRFE